MSQPQLQRHIRWLARDSASVMFTEHVLVRMRQRRILQIEVLDVLRQGRLAGTPEPNAAKGSLECRMQRFLAGRELAVVAAVSEDYPGVVVVTAMVVER
jgi:hypothetical protein